MISCLSILTGMFALFIAQILTTAVPQFSASACQNVYICQLPHFQRTLENNATLYSHGYQYHISDFNILGSEAARQTVHQKPMDVMAKQSFYP